uniref:Methylglutaconyl-CoA hydratase, putative n=1 Tax=Riptortus pedestris TaxID=329032 RepID=R4WJY7_RIPPE|nr:methylglutaconyl-CoA hydratase, putative [Riptortus pedestris]
MIVKRILYSLKKVPTRSFSTATDEGLITDFLKGTDRGIVVVGLNNHKTKNALGKALTQSLHDTFESISSSSNVRVVILRSLVPKVFCAGANLKERLAMKDSEVATFVSSLRNLMLKIESVPCPVISCIEGAALGGGLELALATDIRVASASAKLGLVETKLAIIPGAGGTQRLPRLIGTSMAKELIFTGRILSGKQAKEVGIVNHCVEDKDEGDSAFQRSLEIAREILPNGPLGVKLAKTAINKGIEVDIYKGCAIEELCYAQVIPTKDRIEGLRAFHEKRPPVYLGE